MRNLLLWSVGGAALLMLAGCASQNIPSTGINQPMTARPVERDAVADRNGSIFKAGQNERPLFEDRRARHVGDILTINLVEETSASGKSSLSAAHSGTTTANMSRTGMAPIPLLMNPFNASGTMTATGSLAKKSDSAGDNTFSGTITVTVIEELPNGNLLVGGEKQVVIGQANEYIRFSGVVNPVTITGSNTVQSTQVADAHIEYKGATNVDKSTVMSMLGRLFLSVLPF